jgi:ferredoxin
MKIIVDRLKCSGHARCNAAAPDIFTLDENGYVNFDSKEVKEADGARALRGIRACPERALSTEGGG